MISKILITLNVLAIIPLIICYLAHLISPDQFPYFLVFTFAFPYILGINFLFFCIRHLMNKIFEEMAPPLPSVKVDYRKWFLSCDIY